MENLPDSLQNNSDDDWDVDPENLKKLAEKYKGQDFPLLMDELPADWETNPNYQALHTILYSEQSPEERALSFREQGNEYFSDAATSANKKNRYCDAIRCYNEGLNQKCNDGRLNSLLYSNRAHVRLVIGDFIDCVNDCRFAIKHDPSNIKAYYRAAKGSYYMQLWQQAKMFCTDGLKYDIENEPLLNLKRQTEEKLEEYKKRRKDQERKHDTTAKKRERLQKLKKAYKMRICIEKLFIIYNLRPNVFLDIEVADSCEYDISTLNVNDLHYYESSLDILHWPCLCLYPASNVSEIILDFSDNQTLMDHLEVMFPGDRYAEWDLSQTHYFNNLSVYYEPGVPDGSIFFVPCDVPLKTILSAIGHVACVPVFHIMPTNSSVEKNFREENIIRHAEF